MGWFGFNGGSVLKLGDIASANSVAMVFLNTNAAAAGGLIVALLVARMMFGKADLTMALNGALAGLVAITAEPSTPTPLAATLIGGVGGFLVVFSIVALDKLRIDDPVGAISVHGTVGIWGLLAVPLTNDGTSFVGQLVGMATIFVWVFGVSFVTWLIIKHDHGYPCLRGRGVRGCGHRRVRPRGLSRVHRQPRLGLLIGRPIKQLETGAWCARFLLPPFSLPRCYGCRRRKVGPGYACIHTARPFSSR